MTGTTILYIHRPLDTRGLELVVNVYEDDQ